MSWQTYYPRPLMRRASFLPLLEGWTLNGQPIRMPYPPQSPASGFQGDVPDTLRYETAFALPEGFLPEGWHLRVHFGAVDQVADVFLNGRPVAHHEGGYLPFFADVTGALIPGENALTVVAVDALDRAYPYGKQRRKRGGMWYTPVSGIWQMVWLEAVPEKPIEGVRITPDLTGVSLEVHSPAERCEVRVQLEGMEVLRETFALDGMAKRITLPREHIRWWSPERPTVYDMTVTAGEDRIESYFALRTVDVRRDAAGVQRLCLNGQPLLMTGVLDQGYFPEGIYVPGEPEEYARDVQRMKDLGFNMLRKHIKVEPAAFYEACDRLGMLVIQDMVNSGGYHYLLDTVLPTIGFQRRPNWPVSRRQKQIFTQHILDTQIHLHDHPCIVAYTIFNEGWGQFDADKLYRLCKAADPSRLYDTASGWFIPKESDLDSQHVYFRNKQLHAKDRPLLLSECGGYARPIQGHLWNPRNEYGYGKMDTEDRLTGAICRMYREMVIPAIPKGLCGVVYTQLSDVEDEVNGLYTYDRAVCKVERSRMRAIRREAEEALRRAAQME